jgi:hypothetical protein
MDKEVFMRSLANQEVEHVSGGGVLADIQNSATFGATVGTVVGFVLTETIAGATNCSFI